MIHSVFHRGLEVAAGIDYGLATKDHKGVVRAVQPIVLEGDPEDVKAIVRASQWARGYVTGVLSFAERDLPMKTKRRIMREHLRVMFPGIDPTRIAITYIQHQDKGFLEIHWWAACTDLATGKRVNPYYHRADKARFRLWVQSVNDRFGLGDPNDPARWRLQLGGRGKAPKRYETLRQQVLMALAKQALAGVVKCRQDIERVLVQAHWEVSRRTKNFISISHPSLQKPIRLAGRMFAAGWTGALPPGGIRRLSQMFKRDKGQRLRATLQVLVPLLRQRASYNHCRLGGNYSPEYFVRTLRQGLAALDASTPREGLRALAADIAALSARLGGLPHDSVLKQVRGQLREPGTQPRKHPRVSSGEIEPQEPAL